MPTDDYSDLPPGKDQVYQLIAMNPAPAGRNAVMAAFAYDDASRAVVEKHLSALIDEKVIIADGDKNYRAVHPWADVAYGVIGAVAHNKRTTIPVALLNVPADFDVSVTMSRADVHKHNLQEGDRVVVGLARGSVANAGLRARFIAPMDSERAFTLTGIFNHKSHNFTPLDRSIKANFVLAKEPAADAVPHQFLVELPQSFDMRNPVVHVVGDQTRDMTTGGAISWIVTNKHQIAHAHPGDVLRDAKKISRRHLDLSGRTDLRHLDFVTVDPLGSEDLDDGFATEVGPDGYALYTAIADVPALVRYGSKVDREAFARGITYYMQDHTSHMLPDILSTRKSSLRANEDRLAIVVRQNLGWDCGLKDFEVMAAVVRSREQFSYGQFYDMMERDDPRFRAIAKIQDTRRRRGMNAGLEMFLKENPERYATKSIVETLMVQTNSLIAQFLKSAAIPFLSRNFDSSPLPEVQKRGQVPRAYYASYHLGHGGVGLLHYAHVTSPIRRYADIVNMRAVHKALGNFDIGISDEEIAQLDDTAKHLNERRRIERDATHDVQKYHAIRDLQRLQVAPVRVNIQEIGPDYIDITVVQTGIRQRVSAAALPANQWRIDGQTSELVLLTEQGAEARRYGRNDSLLGQIFDVEPGRARWKINLLPSESGLRPVLVPKPA